MAEMGENVPAYRMIKVSGPEGPVEALADVEAWRARATYPEVLGLGGPVFGLARECETGGWEVIDSFTGHTPQDCRDDLGAHFRRLAKQRAAEGETEAQVECLRMAERLEWEALDELTVLGARYRVVRAERFIRSGPDGPEPPRPSDPDPAEPGEAHRITRPVEGFVMDPAQATAAAEGALKIELLSLVCKAGSVPDDVRDDSVRASRTHPGGVLLPASFMTSERRDGRWVPDSSGVEATPQQARDGLAMSLRVMIPWRLGLSDQEQQPYASAADRLDETRADELEVAGRHFRVVRVERLVRIGPDGPEGPRPSDRDPHAPTLMSREAAQAYADADEDVLPEETEAERRLHELLEAEIARHRARRRKE
ncbi:DUF5954 family protein [Streptomyces sp. 796.1]|uniref:DUF5954 family protein n=1 Tax=Streptomyces sp. 796.1 TaxID=3163029 RepID=UPI0039C9B809